MKLCNLFASWQLNLWARSPLQGCTDPSPLWFSFSFLLSCPPVCMFTVALLCTAGVINKQRPCNYALELSLQLPVGVKIAYWHKLISQQHPTGQPPPAVGPDWPNWPATRVANWLPAPWGQCVPSWGLNTLNYATCSVYCICVYRLLWPNPWDSLLKI